MLKMEDCYSIFYYFYQNAEMRKIYYFPGLISAIAMPLIFWYYGNLKFEEINLNVIDIGLPAKLSKDRGNLNFTFEPLRNLDYKKIKVQPKQAKENSSLYVSEIKKLKERNKQRTGIEFILNENNTYGDFISILNDLYITKSEEYALDLEKTGHLFVIQRYIPPVVEECLLCNDTIATFADSEADSRGYTKFTEILALLPKEAFFIIFGFLFLVNISMLSIKERFQLRY